MNTSYTWEDSAQKQGQFFTRAISHQNNLPREVVNSPTLDTSKIRLDGPSCQDHAFARKDEPRRSLRSLPTQYSMILQFKYIKLILTSQEIRSLYRRVIKTLTRLLASWHILKVHLSNETCHRRNRGTWYLLLIAANQTSHKTT